MYQGFDKKTNDTKKSTKGIPHMNNYEMDTWINVLLNSEFPKQTVTINSLRLNQRKEMSRMKFSRTSLSDIFLKMQVLNDKVSCVPLMKNKEIL